MIEHGVDLACCSPPRLGSDFCGRRATTGTTQVMVNRALAIVAEHLATVLTCKAAYGTSESWS